MTYLNLLDLLESDSDEEIKKLTVQLNAEAAALAAAGAYVAKSEQVEQESSRLSNAAMERCSALGEQLAETQTTVFDAAMRDALSDDDLSKFTTLKNRFVALSEATERFRTYELRNAHREMLTATIAHLSLTENRFFIRHAIEVLTTVGLLKGVAAETGGLNISEQNITTPRSDELLESAFNAGGSKANWERELALYDEESARLRS